MTDEQNHTSYPATVRPAGMASAVTAAPFTETYFKKVVYQPLNAFGLAIRVQEAFGNGRLYDKHHGDLIYLADRSIPSALVLQILKTVALDRVVAATQSIECFMTARRYPVGDPTCPELRGFPLDSSPWQIRSEHRAILHRTLQAPDYRDQVAKELPELF